MTQHILYISDSEALGGAEVYLRALLEHALAEGFRVSLLLPPREATRRLVEAVQALGVQVLAAELAHRPGLRPSIVLGGWQLLRRLRPDIVHFNLPTPRASAELVLAAALAGVPRRIATFQLVTAVPHFGAASAWLRSLNRRLQYRTLQHAIAVSEANKRLLLHDFGLAPDRLSCIPNAVDTAHFAPQQADRSLRAQLGIPDQALVLAFAGRLVISKGLELLLSSMPMLWQAFPDTWLILAGAGNMELSLRSQAAALERSEQIHFLGVVEDVRPLLASCDIVVQPSLAEGLPFAVLEAMAMGRALVASDVGGIAEAVLHGQTGFVVPAGMAEPLATALQRLIADAELRKNMGQAGRARAVAYFSQDVMLARTFALYGRP